MKRMLDVLLSGLALIVLSPLLIPLVVLLKLTGEGEVFFLQQRVGKDRKPFNLYKFATMLKNSPNIGTGTVTLRGDPRVLPVGKFLRKTKINELPQLLNVFFGDMSLVGPRPQELRCFNAFPPELQSVIARVKPGLSGVGPIVFRAEEEMLSGQAGSVAFYDDVIAPYKGRVEAWYVDNQTMANYFRVIFLTFWVVIFPTSQMVWRSFYGLPEPPDRLKGHLNYPSGVG